MEMISVRPSFRDRGRKRGFKEKGGPGDCGELKKTRSQQRLFSLLSSLFPGIVALHGKGNRAGKTSRQDVS